MTTDHQLDANPDGPSRPCRPQPVEPPPAADSQSRQLHPRSVLFWQVENAVLAIVLVGLVVASVQTAWPMPPWSGWVRAALWLGLAFTLFDAGVIIPRRYRYYRYTLTPDSLLVEHGRLFRRRRAYPLSRILYSEARQGPLLRWFGLYTVRAGTIIESAAIGPIDKNEADRFERAIREHSP